MDEKNTTNMPDGYITTAEALKKYDINRSTLYCLIREKRIHSFKPYGRLYVNEGDLQDYEAKKKREIASPFGDIILDFDESVKPLDGIHNPNFIKHIGQYITKPKYVVSNKGKVFNLDQNSQFEPSDSSHGYKQVVLQRFNGALKVERVHVLVALLWCPNAKLKSEVHHIDGNKLNNNASNLIWLTAKEHDEAHSLLKTATETNDDSDYQAFITEKAKENQWDKEYRCLFFEWKDSCIFGWVQKSIYDDYLTGKITLSDITNTDSMKMRMIVLPFGEAIGGTQEPQGE